jgi:epoxyqueuosine reductase
MNELKSCLRGLAMAQGFSGFGVSTADPPESLGALDDWLAAGREGTMSYMRTNRSVREGPELLLPGARSVISVALNYYQEGSTDPKIARYALGRDYHKVIRQRLRPLAKHLIELGFEARICVDSAPLMEREYAHRAGLGWFGKNTMLIDSKRGSWFLLGEVITTASLEPDQPSAGGCGTCRACIDACPSGAIVFEDGRWQVDARKCVSYLTIEHRGPLDSDPHGWVFGCDICQEVCPFNQPRESQPLRSEITTIPDFLERRAWPKTLSLATISEAQWEQLSQGSAVRRTGIEGIRRNAKLALR